MGSDAILDTARRKLRRKIGSFDYARVAVVNGSNYDAFGNVYVRSVGGVEDGTTVIVGSVYALPIAPGRNVIVRTGRLVRVGEIDGDLYILHNEFRDLRAAGISTRQLNGNDDSKKFTTIEALVNLNSFRESASASTVNVFPSIYRKADGSYGIFTSETGIDVVTAYRPTDTTLQRVVCLWLQTDNTTTITASATVSQDTDLKRNPTAALLSINECAAAAPAGAIGIYSYIVKGNSSFPEKFHDLRGIIGTAAAGVSVQTIAGISTVASGKTAYFIGPVRLSGTLTVSGEVHIL